MKMERKVNELGFPPKHNPKYLQCEELMPNTSYGVRRSEQPHWTSCSLWRTDAALRGHARSKAVI